MEFKQNDDYLESSPFNRAEPNPEASSPPPAPANPPAYQGYERPRKKSGVWRVFWGILFVLSVLANVGMFLLLIGAFVVIASGQANQYEVSVIQEGSTRERIVVVNVTGIIDDDQAEQVRRQLKETRRDRNVRGVIVRVNSPGGTVSGSDRIYEELRKYRQERSLPVVAFMQGVAASGGYYAAVACEEIIAEPTTITGSIGVVMSHFVLQDLLENKLGVQPVFLVEGDKKDWPSSFRAPTEEELQYVRQRILTPAYERFVEVVQQGRTGRLTRDEVRALADGSIYTAPGALTVDLIDDIGYLEDAIEAVAQRANLSSPEVVEYRRPFSLMGLLQAKSMPALRLDRTTLYEMTAPQVMYLWNAR